MKVWSIDGMVTVRGTKALEESIPKFNPVHHKAHMNYPGAGEKPDLH
jgi:hypothetical protein